MNYAIGIVTYQPDIARLQENLAAAGDIPLIIVDNGSGNVADIRAVAALVLSHRMRRRPFEEAAFDTEELERCLQSI